MRVAIGLLLAAFVAGCGSSGNQPAFSELHPYKVPELLALPVEAGLEKYLEWINGETTLALA